MVEHRSAESEGLRFDSSRELRIFLYATLVIWRKTSFCIIFLFRGQGKEGINWIWNTWKVTGFCDRSEKRKTAKQLFISSQLTGLKESPYYIILHWVKKHIEGKRKKSNWNYRQSEKPQLKTNLSKTRKREWKTSTPASLCDIWCKMTR